MKTKVCTRCKVEKPLEEFRPRSREKDGLSFWCKRCELAYTKTRADKARAYRKEYTNNTVQENKKKRSEILLRHFYKNKHKMTYKEKKRRVLAIAANAYKALVLVRPYNCIYCGKKCDPHGHHWDYDLPLTIAYFCIQCHRKMDSILRSSFSGKCFCPKCQIK